jgi:hypothetical protein
MASQALKVKLIGELDEEPVGGGWPRVVLVFSATRGSKVT